MSEEDFMILIGNDNFSSEGVIFDSSLLVETKTEILTLGVLLLLKEINQNGQS
jgi:hypothetical protein